MSLVSVAKLAALLGETTVPSGAQESLDVAEAVVAAYLGTPTLSARAGLVQTQHVLNASRIVELTDGPLVTLNSVTVDGAALDLADVTAEPWFLGYFDGFARGATVAIDFDAGWADEAALPDQLIQAVLLAAVATLRAPAGGMLSERIGDYSYQLAQDAASESLPLQSRILANRWARPQL